MGVYCDRFVGYSIDVLDDFESLSDNIREKWTTDFNGENTAEFDKINFTPYYNSGKLLKNTVTLLYDGMSGSYCKLVYVTEYELRGVDDYDENVIDGINKMLTTSEIPFDVKAAMRKVYEYIFGKELERTSDIKAEYLVHYH